MQILSWKKGSYGYLTKIPNWNLGVTDSLGNHHENYESPHPYKAYAIHKNHSNHRKLKRRWNFDPSWLKQKLQMLQKLQIKTRLKVLISASKHSVFLLLVRTTNKMGNSQITHYSNHGGERQVSSSVNVSCQ